MTTGANCRSCGAEITWARTERGNRMPLDRAPVPAATAQHTFVLRDMLSYEGPLAIAATPAQLPGEKYYVSHFATCPDALLHRRR